MKIVLNGDSMEISEGASVANLVEVLGLPDKGIAVAVDWEVLPRSEWHTTLSDGSKVEVVTAVQGG
jgi:sulfur carrier protein